MCGRYTFTPDNNFYQRFDIQNSLDALENRYNVAPGQEMPVITRNSPNRVTIMRWGLIPFWVKDPAIGYKTINARMESVQLKPAFRKPFQNNRCLIPANGFYEWSRATQPKKPYYFKLKNNKSFAFAGLCDSWKDENNMEINSYTIITTTANSLVGQIHNRMPVILAKENETVWLDHDTDLQTAYKLLQQYHSELMEGYQVNKEINNARVDNVDLIRPIASECL